jgi:VWFA-related protein
VAFNEDVLWLAEATADKDRVRQALARLRAGGATAAYDALYAGIVLSEGERRSLIVLFTDGEDNSSWLGEADLRTVAQRSNALVHVVGWRAPRSAEEQRKTPLPQESPQERGLREIAEAAGGRYWQADSPERLRKAFSEIADAMGHRYVLRYEPTGVARDGWHRIELRLRGVKGEVHVRRGYWLARE